MSATMSSRTSERSERVSGSTFPAQDRAMVKGRQIPTLASLVPDDSHNR
jgi:hypothetical protein